MNNCSRRVSIVGIGNPLLGDDRAGYCLVEALRQCSSTQDICFYTLETLSSSEIWVLENKDLVVFVDVVEDYSKPGEIKIYKADPQALSHEELVEVLKNIDPHETDPAKLILLAYASGIDIGDIYIVGIRAPHYAIGEPVSEPVRRKLQNLVDNIKSILEDHGLELVYDKKCFSEKIRICTSSTYLGREHILASRL